MWESQIEGFIVLIIWYADQTTQGDTDMKNPYQVRFTPEGSTQSTVIGYSSARRAKEIVELTHTRHAAAKTKAEYLGRAR